MAYEKYTWVDGELITAEKLNHMEDGIAEGGSGEAGYECTETTEQLFNETVTTADHDGVSFSLLAYSAPITADELIVTFDGTEYVCPKIEDNGVVQYGGFDPNTGMPDFTNYPFIISSHPSQGNIVATESSMTATISASATSSTVETTECFEEAVLKIVSPMLFECKKSVERSYTDDSLTTVVEEGFLPKAVIPEGVTAYGIKVVLDGVTYFCPRSMMIDRFFYYGSVDFSMTDFPFVIEYDPVSSEESTLYTETAGVHSVRIDQYRYTPTNVSPCLASVIEQIVTISQDER